MIKKKKGSDKLPSFSLKAELLTGTAEGRIRKKGRRRGERDPEGWGII